MIRSVALESVAEWAECEHNEHSVDFKRNLGTTKAFSFLICEATVWKCGRVVEGNSLENCRGETHRGFESLHFR